MNIESNSELLENGWVRVKTPLPNSLRYVNSYLIPEPQGGWTLLDPGMNTEQARIAWEHALNRHGIEPAAISRVVLTHQHPDHYGLAGWFQQQSGCPVWMTAEAYRYVHKAWGSGESGYGAQLASWLGSYGMPEELLDRLADHQDSFFHLVEPQPDEAVLAELKPGQSIALGGEDWEVIDAPGHASGGVCFYSEASATMISGDQVLPRITPNISLVPGEDEDPDPLRSYLDSLKLLSGYRTARVYPGHLEPFENLGSRAIEIIQHHEKRLDHLLLLLKEGPSSAFELCEKEFGSHLRSNIHNLRFAMSETLAHLIWLVRSGKALQRFDSSGKHLFAAAHVD